MIVGGVAPPPGDTIWEQSRFIAEDETLRNFVLNEPRGGVFRHVNLLVPPKDPRAQMGWIIMEPADTPPMSGSNSMCVVDRAARHRHRPDAGAGDAADPRSAGRSRRGHGRLPRTARPSASRSATCPPSPTSSTRSSRSRALARSRVDTAYGGDSFVIADAHGARLCDPPR